MKGQCLCGAVSYECGDPQMLMHCYCKDCQRVTGAAYAPIYIVPADSLNHIGELGSYTITGSEGAHIKRSFCTTCGGQLFSGAEEVPTMVFVKAGSVDELPEISPAMICWTDSAPKWATFPENVPRFPKNPPMGG